MFNETNPFVYGLWIWTDCKCNECNTNLQCVCLDDNSLYYASFTESIRPLSVKQPMNKFLNDCLLLHTFRVGRSTFSHWTGSSLKGSDFVTFRGFLQLFFESVSFFWQSTLLSFSVSSVWLFVLWEHVSCRTGLYLYSGSGIALKWKKYSSGHRQLRSKSCTLSAWSMWCR